MIYILLGALVLLAGLVLYIFSSVQDLDHSDGAGVGLIFIPIVGLMIVVLVVMAFLDATIFLIALAVLVLIGFIFIKVLGAISRDQWNYQSEVHQSRQAEQAYREAEQGLKTLAEEGPVSSEEYLHEEGKFEDYLDYFSREGCGNLLQFAPDDVRANRKLVSVAIKHPHLIIQTDWANRPTVVPTNSPLKHASSALRQDEALVLEAISFCADAYEFASDDLRADPDVYLAAISADLEETSYSYDQGGIEFRWDPAFDDSFYDDPVRLYEFLGELRATADSSWLGGHHDDMEGIRAHINEFYEQYFPEIFKNWEVVCQVFSNKSAWDSEELDPYGEYFPDWLYSNEDGVESRKSGITNREFILFAMENGYPDVIEHAADTLRTDKEIRSALKRARHERDEQNRLRNLGQKHLQKKRLEDLR